MKRTLSFLLVASLVSATLAACGDTTNTAAPVGSGGGAATGATPGLTTPPGQTTASNTAATSTTAASATTAVATTATITGTTVASTTPAAATTMAGMTMTPGSSMPGTTMLPGTTAAAGNNPMVKSLQSLSGAEFETKFMQYMIAHHTSAIQMAKLVPTNTRRPELIKLSQDIISAQTKEIDDMTGWLASWYNAKPLADITSVPGMTDTMSQMDQLKIARDADFDKMFLSMMIEHHTIASNMASLVPQKTQRPELLKLSQDIIKSQSAEIEQMKAWQKAWFPA